MSIDAITKALEKMGAPCGRTTGHGESCTKGWECGACGDKAKLCAALRVAVARLEEIEDTIKDARCGCCMDTTAAVCLDQIASILGDRGSRGQG